MELINRALDKKEAIAARDLNAVLTALEIQTENVLALAGEMEEGFFDIFDPRDENQHPCIAYEFMRHAPFSRMLYDHALIVLDALRELDQVVREQGSEWNGEIGEPVRSKVKRASSGQVAEA